MNGHLDEKSSSFFRLALQPDATLHHFDQFFDKGQTDAGAYSLRI
ncbi:MAG: hypothetical protein R2788_05270 [Saprospiraceae bacterium]